MNEQMKERVKAEELGIFQFWNSNLWAQKPRILHMSYADVLNGSKSFCISPNNTHSALMEDTDDTIRRASVPIESIELCSL